MTYERLEAWLERYLARITREIAVREKLSLRFSWIRLGVFLGTVLCAFALYWINLPTSWAVVIVGGVLFGISVRNHRRVEKSLHRFRQWHAIQTKQLARIQLDWEKLKPSSDTGVDPDHPFAIDLYIVGPRSLLTLIDTAVSVEGHERLFSWLTAGEHVRNDVLLRQQRVRELKGLSHFRNRLQLDFRLTGAEALHGRKIKNWLHSLKSEKKLRNRFLIACGLWGMTWLGVLGHFFLEWPGYWWYGALAALGWYMGHKGIWGDLGADAEILDSEFRQAVTMFQYLEKFDYSAHPQLRELCGPFFSTTEKPARKLRRMTWLAFGIGLRMNYLFWIMLHLITPWDFWCAYRLNIQKRRLKTQFSEWLEICYELEALNSLANFAWLNSAAVFPELTENVKKATVFLEADQLGHPLISYQKRVGNPVKITSENKVHLITGSNMAGKSTFLRTIGINLILARAGSPVIATRMTAGLYKIFTCIKVNDSVSDGYSQFYAEVRRLRALLDVIETQKAEPVLFLIDEIYRGTNNRERLIGSQAFVDKLLEYENCFGMITTHDLELTGMGTTKTAISNFHFRETVVDRKMNFDYVLRTGPCPTTNALVIMDMEGLPVGPAGHKKSRQT